MRRLSKMHLLQDVGKNNVFFKRLNKPKLFFQTILYSGKEMKPFSLQGNNSTKIKNTKTVPD